MFSMYDVSKVQVQTDMQTHVHVGKGTREYRETKPDMASVSTRSRSSVLHPVQRVSHAGIHCLLRVETSPGPLPYAYGGYAQDARQRRKQAKGEYEEAVDVHPRVPRPQQLANRTRCQPDQSRSSSGQCLSGWSHRTIDRHDGCRAVALLIGGVVFTASDELEA